MSNLQDLVKGILEHIEPDQKKGLREGLKNTPKRVVESWDELYSGYNQNPKEILDATFNGEGYDGIVLLKDIEFYSTCEHHLLSFTGKAHVAYIPQTKIVGISKLARLVEVYAKRLQNQERITTQVADALEKYLKPLGAAIIIEAKHDCMGCRGVKKSHAIMTTSAMRGVFFDKAEARSELMQLIK
ncbi:MAG: GTP cyclohydrolase I FolE [Methanobacteriota archaeon]|jgi:GTP cyclohydrolase I|nr:MAG: GTP cyclohydrolase I FolE [Euryarchaeota archaeon]